METIPQKPVSAPSDSGAKLPSLFSENNAPLEPTAEDRSFAGFLNDLFTDNGAALIRLLGISACVSLCLSPIALLFGVVGFLSQLIAGFTLLRSLHSMVGSLGFMVGFFLLSLLLLFAQKVLSRLPESKK